MHTPLCHRSAQPQRAMALIVALGVAIHLACAVSGCSGTATLPPAMDGVTGIDEDASLPQDPTDVAQGTPVDDDTTQTDDALSPSPECTSDVDCAGEALPACQLAVCDTPTGTCTTGSHANGTPCDDGDPCTTGELCEAGGCTGGTPALPACGDLECGDDACGHPCGGCDPGVSCQNGQCVPPGGDATGLTCDTVSYEGCCTASGTLVWCEGDSISTMECSQNPSCGWAADDAFYNCGMPDALPDPSGTNAYLCPGETCSTSCEERECGYACGAPCGTCEEGSVCQDGACVTCSCDGVACGLNTCGESCGDCVEGSFCDADNQCLECSCDGLSCGADPCGNSCGLCDAGLACVAGACVDDPCEGVTFEGCCDGDTLQYCDNGTLQSLNCSSSPSCGWDASAGYYDCGNDATEDPSGASAILCPNVCYPTCAEESACGDDGCGGSCGDCAEGDVCGDDGLCTTPCSPNCAEENACGDDGCGGSCGDCANDVPCEDGLCNHDSEE
ncbi:MAG: hypothetical protein ACPGU1_09480 [Myxococcota bacterium]